jgi:hypothetical protein
LQHDVFAEDLELANLEWEEATISTQLLQMQKGCGMSFWAKPILYLDRPQGDDPKMIIINKCGLCGQWYHCGDIIVTSCLHTYHPACIREHLKINNRCKVCNQWVHLDWWFRWGFRDLD